MKKISTREYSKHYILNLLPTANSDDELTYIASETVAIVLEKWIKMMVKLLVNEPTLAQNILLRTKQLTKNGGALMSLKTVYTPINETTPTDLVFLDLSYAVTKDVQFAISGLDVTKLVAKSDKLTGLVTRFMKDLYAGHEESYGENTRDAFIEEVFLIDGVEMVLDANSQFKIKVDRSLRDYLVALNSRLRISA